MPVAQLTCERKFILRDWEVERVLNRSGAMGVRDAYQEENSVPRLAREVSEMSSTELYQVQHCACIRNELVACIDGKRGKRFRRVLHDKASRCPC